MKEKKTSIINDVTEGSPTSVSIHSLCFISNTEKK